MPKFSAIMPVYNVAQYLPQSIESVLGQSYREIELICVNDGSTDNSLDILSHYAQQDSRVRVISIPNSGVSVARNEGIKAAKGEWIAFIDGDDWLKTTAYEELVQHLEQTSVDMLIFGYYEAIENEIKFPNLNNLLQKYQENPSLISKDILFLRLSSTVWNHLYRREFIIKNKIEFPQGLVVSEDSVFNMQCCTKNPRVATVGDGYYFYRIFREGSTLSTKYDLNNVLEQKRYCDKSEFYQQADFSTKILIDLKIAGSLLFRYNLLDENTQKENCSYLKQYKKYLEKVYGKKNIKAYSKYHSLRKAIKNSENKCHKTITLFGIKMHFRCCKK